LDSYPKCTGVEFEYVKNEAVVAGAVRSITYTAGAEECLLPAKSEAAIEQTVHALFEL